MKECDRGRRGCWADAAEWPGFSIVEMLYIHVLCARRKILVVPNISNMQCQGEHLVGSEQIWGRTPQITWWQDVQYHQELHCPKAYACASCGVIWSTSEHGVNNLLTTEWIQSAGWPVDLTNCCLRVLTLTILHHKMQKCVIYSGVNSWWYCTSCICVICGGLLQICSLPTRCPARRGALDMCGTARIFRFEYNTCIRSTSKTLNSGHSATLAQHPLLPPSHSFIASG